MLFCRGVLPWLNGPSFKALDFRLHPLPSAAVSAALPRGQAVLASLDVGVGFSDRAAAVVAVGFLRIYGFTISASVKPLRPCRLLTPMRNFLTYRKIICFPVRTLHN